MAERRRLVSKPQGGLFSELGVQVRLLSRLMTDARVNPLLKLLPAASLLYLLFPFDFLGPVDDAFVIWLGSSLFIELCPQELVEEHRAALEPVRKGKQGEDGAIRDEDIIEASYRENE